MTPIGGEALRPSGDEPLSILDWSNQQLLHLALARLEAKPGLRANATVAKGCTFLVDQPLWNLVAAARTYAAEPAKKFFDATVDMWKDPPTPAPTKAEPKAKPKPKPKKKPASKKKKRK